MARVNDVCLPDHPCPGRGSNLSLRGEHSNTELQTPSCISFSVYKTALRIKP